MIQVILFFTYVFSAIYFPVMTDFISPVHNFISAIIIYLAAQKMKTFRTLWYLISAMVLFWGIGELIYLVTIDKAYVMPIDITPVMTMMLASNIIMLIIVIIYFIKHLGKWNRIQLTADILIMTIMVLGIGSGLYFTKLEYYFIKPEQVVAVLIILCIDLVTLLLILSMVSSTRVKTKDTVLIRIAIAFCLHIIADMFDGYGFFIGNENSIIITDILILMSFNLFTLTALSKLKAAEKENTLITEDEVAQVASRPENLGQSKVVIIIAVIPIVLILLGVLDVNHFTAIMIAILIYVIFNAVLQRYIMSGIMLKQEQDMKEKLEKIVEERTAELIKTNELLAIESDTDSLTGLYNRKFFFEELQTRIKKKNESFAVFFIDLDRFKVINDIHGHIMGDQVLIEIADRFKVRQCDKCMFARFGGDEFAVIYDSVDLKELEATGDKIHQLINEKIVIDDFEFSVAGSIGIARYPEDAKSANELLKFADIAMYHAKNQDQVGKYVIHSDQFAEKVGRRNYVELLLKDAKFSDFELYYQPQFTTDTKELIGMEALVRWNHGVEGFISPAEFIPIAEEIGIIKTLSDWVFETGIKQIKVWNEKYNMDLVMSLNISPVSIDSVVFLPNLIEMLDELEVKPEWVGFEITEHSAMASATQMEEFLTSLSGIGVQISIDDFGTGYSSLSYLKRFDVDVIKIAKELIDNIEFDHNDLLIVKAIIMMTEGMGLETLAEGVETEAQLDILKELSCNKIQGYIFGRPLPADVFETEFYDKVN